MASTANDTQVLNDERDEHDKLKTQPVTDPHLDSPRSPAWKRAALVALLAILFSLAFFLRPGIKPTTNIIHASRYLKEFKYRPAASPVIAERLKYGNEVTKGASDALKRLA